MMKTILIFFYFFCLMMSFTQQRPDFKVFFMELRTAAAEKNVEKLKTLVYLFKDEVEDVQAGLIDMVINGSVNQDGDGAFSLRALDILIEKHLRKIELIDEKLFKQLSQDAIFGKPLRKTGMENIYVFDHAGVHIILFNTKTGIKLFFWENLNKLL